MSKVPEKQTGSVTKPSGSGGGGGGLNQTLMDINAFAQGLIPVIQGGGQFQPSPMSDRDVPAPPDEPYKTAKLVGFGVGGLAAVVLLVMLAKNFGQRNRS